jgi:RHS repeat-associated protein
MSLPCFSLKNFSIALLVNAGLVHMSLYGNVLLTTFEAPITPGTNLSAVSTAWTVTNGEAKVVAGSGYQGTQGVKITKGDNAEARITRAITWNAAEQTAFIDFRVKPAANVQGSNAAIMVNGSQIGLQRQDDSTDPNQSSKGDIWVLNGTDRKWISGSANLDGGLSFPQWLLTHGQFQLNSAKTAATDFIRITLRQDYERKVWDIYVNGNLTGADLRFEKQGILNALHIFGSSADDVFIDELQTLPTNMLFPDADKDGIPDSVEVANGSNPNAKDRDSIDPVTGKSYLQKYLQQLWPDDAPAGTGTYVATGTTIPPLTLPEHSPVGALKGNFSVGGDGSATYSVPIDLPKGTSGMEPQLSLGYSSNGGNSICGVGFGLSGLQSISRGPSSLKKDGVIDGVDFDEKDRFFLNGERLVCVAGTYGMDGSIYRTEMDAYSQIKLFGNANSGQGSYWQVQTKAGLTIEFGNTKGSKVTCQGAPAPLSWAVNRVLDVKSNYYDVLYAEGPSDVVIANDAALIFGNNSINSHRVAEIKYTGNLTANEQPYITVKFNYEDRADTSFAYSYGIKSESNKRLSSIEVKTDSYVNHTYLLAYVTSGQTERSMLQMLSKFVTGGTGPLATTFHWDAHLGSLPTSMWKKASHIGSGNLPQLYEYGSGQNNDSGIISYASLEENNTVVHLTGNAWRAKAINYTVTPNTKLTFDYKASSNPRSEIVAIGLDTNLTPDSTRIYQIDGSQAEYNQAYKPGTVHNAGSDGNWVTVTIPVGSHFTGNASHLALINDDDNQENGIGECYFRNIRIYESGQTEGLITFQPNQWEVPELSSSTWVDRGYNFVDINSDGLIDIVRNSIIEASSLDVTSSVRQTLLNHGTGWTAEDQTWQLPSGAFLTSNDGDATDTAFSYVRGSSTFTDFNADGRPDIMQRSIIDSWDGTDTSIVNFQSQVNNGNGWTPTTLYSYPFSTHRQSGYAASTNNRFRDWVETDLNGDGFPDLIANTYRGTTKGVINPSFHYESNYNRANDEFMTLLYKPFALSFNSWTVSGTASTNGTITDLGYTTPNAADPTQKGYLSQGIGKDDLGRGLIDLNGDGLPELYAASNSVIKTFKNMGDGWDWVKLPDNTWICHDKPAMRLPKAIVNASGSSQGSRLVDLNGDGLPDFLRGLSSFTGVHTLPGNQLSVDVNNGNDSLPGVSSMFTSITSAVGQNWITPYTLDWDGSGIDNFGNELADINGDGLTDLIFSSNYVNKSYLNTGTNFADKTAYAFPAGVRICSTTGQLDNKRRNARLVDVNGDGFPDILGNLNKGAPEVWLNDSKSETINKIVDGFGSDIQIEYTRLNDPTNKPGFNSRVYQKNNGALPPGQMAVIDSRLVVYRYSAPSYLNGTNNRRYTSHRYGDLRYDRNNETSLGFAWAEIQDELTQQITRTEYRQDFPFAGSPSVTHTKVFITRENIDTAASHGSSIFEGATAGWKCLTKETADYAQKQPELGIGGGGYIYRPVQIEAIKEQYDLKRSSSATSPEPCGDFKSRTRTTQALADYDNYGFLRNSIVESLDGSIIATSSVYDHNIDDTKWHLGRLKASAVVKSKIGHITITKSSNFTYDAFGMLKTETIEPGNALSVNKSYTYDDFGNITHSHVIGKNSQGNLETRSSQSIYDARGRFVIEEKNQLNHRVLYQYDLNRALLKNTTDINGLVTQLRYDDFGTLTLTLHPDGTRTGEVTGQVFSNNSVVPANLNVPNIIKYYRAKQTSGGPVGFAYFDAAGREILSRSTTLVNGTASGEARYANIYSHNQYDAFGRTTHTSLPFAGNEAPIYSQRLVDVLGRTYKTIHLNGSFDKVDCYGVAMLNGQPTTYSCTTATNGQTLERWEDQHGQMIQSRDESGLITAFIHDLEGRLTSVKMENTPRTTRASSDVLAADHTLLLRNKFDIFGNKSEVWEINSGTSTSTFSALGEVATSTNAMGQTTSYEYDVLGRPTKIIRPDGEGTFINEYDTAGGTAATGKPSKITGPSGYLEDIIYDSLGRPTSTSKTQFGETFNTFTSYDALGRVKTSTDAGGLTTCTHYDERYSIPVKIVLASPPSGMTVLPGVGTTLWEAGTFDPRGNALTQKLGNGVNIAQAYQTSTGHLLGLNATRAGSLVQNKAYAWDSAGNLTSRTNNHVRNANGSTTSITSLHESFGYDIQNRLTSRTIGSNVENYSYDVKGNLLTKPGAALTYNKPGPHQVGTATIKGAARTYQYNTAGYVTSDSKRNYYWSSFGQLKDLTYSAAPALQDLAGTQIEPAAFVQSQFFCDAAGNRARQWKTRTSTGSYKTESTLYLGSYEREIHSSSVHPGISVTEHKRVHRHSLGDMVYTRSITPNTGETVRLTTKLDDHLGSTDVLITSKWQNNTFTHESSEYQAYDPWGERAATTTAVAFRQTDSDPFRRSAQDYDRGYTGHEMLDDSGIIHMNGRLYDAELGRMLSADPFVQVPEYSQNFNRYSYVLNNPLNKTDPTGYSWLSKAFHKIGSWVKENWRTIVSIVFFAVAMWAIGAAFYAAFHATLNLVLHAGLAGAMTGAFSSAISGGDILKGALTGAITGAVGGMLGGYGALVKNLGAATASGLSNVIMGGKFGDGFISSLKYGAIFEGATIVGKFASSYLSKNNINEIGGVSTDEHLDTIDQGYQADKDLSYNTKNNLGDINNSSYNTGGFRMKRFYSDRPTSNLDYAVFVNDIRKIRLMNMVGTQTGGDWMDNLLQGLGFKSKQYMAAIEQAQIQQSIAVKQGYTFVINGHSLGGGLAAAASAVTGAPAATFNAAGLNPLTLHHAGFGDKAHLIGSNVVHHSVAGELLTATEYSPLNIALPVPAAANYYVYTPKLGFWDAINPLTTINLHRPPHTLRAIKE